MITHLYQSNTFLLFFFHTDCEASRKTKSKEKHFRPPQSGYGRNEERRPQGTRLRLIHTEFTVFDPKSEAPVLLQLVSFRTWTSSSKQSVTRTSAWPAVAGTPLRWASHFFFFIFLFFFSIFCLCLLICSVLTPSASHSALISPAAFSRCGADWAE